LSTTTRNEFGHFATEFLVIFASIVLALLADDWREARNERNAEQRALQLILRDLRTDSADLLTYRGKLAEQELHAARLFSLLESGPPFDSLATEVGPALSIWNYRPALSAYRGLAQAGRLTVIHDETLRDRVVSYHDDTIAYLDDLRESVNNRSAHVIALFEAHAGRRPAADGSWSWTVAGSADGLRRDVQALSALGNAAATRRLLRARIDDLFMKENTELRRAIEAYLAR
jgi:hypothetical protein